MYWENGWYTYAYTYGYGEIVFLSTFGRGQVVGLKDHIGSLEVRQKFDALVIDADGIVNTDGSLWPEESDREAVVKL